MDQKRLGIANYIERIFDPVSILETAFFAFILLIQPILCLQRWVDRIMTKQRKASSA